MHDRATSTLLRLELRRGREQIRKGWYVVIGMVGVMVLLFGGGSEGWSMGLGVLGFTYGLVPAMRALMDKLDGSLEFLTSLPVAPRQMAATALISCGGYAVLAAVPWTAAVALFAPAYIGVSVGPFSYLGFFLVLWLGVTTVSALLTGTLIRFAAETLNWLPVAVMVVVIGGLAAVGRIWPEADKVVLGWLLAPDSPARLFVLLLTLEAVTLVVAFRLLRSGFHRFRPSSVTLPEHLAPFKP